MEKLFNINRHGTHLSRINDCICFVEVWFFVVVVNVWKFIRIISFFMERVKSVTRPMCSEFNKSIRYFVFKFNEDICIFKHYTICWSFDVKVIEPKRVQHTSIPLAVKHLYVIKYVGNSRCRPNPPNTKNRAMHEKLQIEFIR